MRILFYDDVPIFGGHEAMTLHAVEYLLQHTNETIIFMLSHMNSRLSLSLEQLQSRFAHLILQRIPFHTASFQGFRTLCSPKQIAAISNLLCSHSPDVILLVQGGIEISTLGMLAARRAQLPIISYIPFAHSMRLTGAALGPARDLVNRYFYQCPQEYITISDSMALSLRDQGVTVPIHVAPNCLDITQNHNYSYKDARKRLELQDDVWVLGIIGRVNFKQKRHDFLLRSLAKHRDRLEPWQLLVVGDGPDLPALYKLIESLNLYKHVRCVPWCQDMSGIYSALDAVTIPSHYEGVPLVMLEAMYYELPIIASDRDGMKDILPAEWLFRVDDADALINALARVRHHVSSTLTTGLKAEVENRFTPSTFGSAFYKAILTAMS